MQTPTLTIIPTQPSTPVEIPLAGESIRAGFPSPAENYLETSIDLNKELVRHAASTFFARVSGDSMKDAGIFDGDLLVIDKSLEVRNGDVAVCFVDGEFTIKFVKIDQGEVWLVPANEEFKAVKMTEDNEFTVWGVVTHSIKKHR